MERADRSRSTSCRPRRPRPPRFRPPATRAPRSPPSISRRCSGDLATSTQIAAGTLLPTALGGASVKVKDGARARERSARCFSSRRDRSITRLLARPATGPATVTVTNNGATVGGGSLAVDRSRAGLFTADAEDGIPGRRRPTISKRFDRDRAPSYNSMPRKSVRSRPIDLGGRDGTRSLLVLSARVPQSALGNVLMALGGTDAQVLFAGAQGSLVGLDQLNVRILRRSGARAGTSHSR